MKKLPLLYLLVLSFGTGLAQQKNYSVGPALQDNSAKAELSSFEIAPGYDVSLFASEENGIANPTKDVRIKARSFRMRDKSRPGDRSHKIVELQSHRAISVSKIIRNFHM